MMRILAVFLLGLSSQAAAEDVRRVHCPSLEALGPDLPIRSALAMEAFTRARDQYIREEYQKAARTFHESYQRATDAARDDLIWNAAVAFERAGERTMAAALYRCYLPFVQNSDERRRLEARIVVLHDVGMPAPDPTSAPRREDRDLATEEALRAQGGVAPQTRRARLWPWLLGSAVALGGSGVVIGWLANRHEDELASSCGKTVEGCSDGDIAGVKHRALAANIFYATAGTAAIASALFYFHERERPRAALVPLGTGAAIVGHW